MVGPQDLESSGWIGGGNRAVCTAALLHNLSQGLGPASCLFRCSLGLGVRWSWGTGSDSWSQIRLHINLPQSCSRPCLKPCLHDLMCNRVGGRGGAWALVGSGDRLSSLPLAQQSLSTVLPCGGALDHWRDQGAQRKSRTHQQ